MNRPGGSVSALPPGRAPPRGGIPIPPRLHCNTFIIQLNYEYVKTVVTGVILVIGIYVFAAAALVITGAAIEVLRWCH